MTGRDFQERLVLQVPADMIYDQRLPTNKYQRTYDMLPQYMFRCDDVPRFVEKTYPDQCRERGLPRNMSRVRKSGSRKFGSTKVVVARPAASSPATKKRGPDSFWDPARWWCSALGSRCLPEAFVKKLGISVTTIGIDRMDPRKYLQKLLDDLVHCDKLT